MMLSVQAQPSSGSAVLASGYRLFIQLQMRKFGMLFAGSLLRVYQDFEETFVSQ
jgi:hypothetical protein